MDNTIKLLLKKYWNIENLKDKQNELLSYYMDNNDVIGLLPTGYGKSLCYLLPPLISNKVIFIISPLISLMEDQKEKLIKMEIPVATLHSSNINKDKEIFQIIDGSINIVYMSPEYLIKGNGIELATTLMDKGRLGYLAVDESHCVSAWGHDFREDYLKINIFRQQFPSIPIMALTATATIQVVDDIIKNLNIRNPKIVIANFDRPNIYLKCIGIKKNNIECIEEWLLKYKDHKIIIYTNSRNDSEELSKEINNKYGKISESYHAGMTKMMRNKIQTKFNNNSPDSSKKINIIVSTVAFGMGIDQTVRCVLIFGSPNSIEEYYQMIGRAGRDGEAAESVLLFQYKNVIIGNNLIKKSGLDTEIIETKLKGLNRITKYFNTPICRRRYILEYFGQVSKFYWCNYCDNCCENKLVDLTQKFIKVLFQKGNYNDVFTKKDLKIAIQHDLIAQRSENIYETLHTIKQWKKIIEVNKYIEKGIPNKYLIKCVISDSK